VPECSRVKAGYRHTRFAGWTDSQLIAVNKSIPPVDIRLPAD